MPRRRRNRIKDIEKHKDRVLRDIYYNPNKSGSFGGIDQLYKAVKNDNRINISRYQVKKWLCSQDVYTQNTQTYKIFPKRRVYASTIDEFYDADLAEFPGNFPKANSGLRYLLVVVDVLSRFLFVHPLKNKEEGSIIKAFDYIFNNSSRICSRLRTDRGLEFTSQKVGRYLKSKGIIHYLTHQETKASFAERAIKVLKQKIYKYIDHKSNYHFLDVLPEIVRSYNSSYNRIIKTSPDKVTKENDHIIWERTYWNTLNKRQNKPSRYKFKVGDYCRISYERKPFDKNYSETRTEELFIVRKRLKTQPTTYLLKDLKDEDLDGCFYDKELQKVIVNDNKIYKIEKVLDRRISPTGKNQSFVKWSGYPDKFNEWIDSNIIKE